MENNNFLETLSSRLSQNASVKNVFGEPVHAGEKTIIPVAQIAYGFGGGQGQGGKRYKPSASGETPKQEDGAGGEGSGGGGGLSAKAKGVFEITPTRTRFIPANNTAPLLIGLVIGFLLRGCSFKRHRKK